MTFKTGRMQLMKFVLVFEKCQKPKEMILKRVINPFLLLSSGVPDLTCNQVVTFSSAAVTILSSSAETSRDAKLSLSLPIM